MAMKTQIDWPDDEALVGIIERNGSRSGAARYLTVAPSSLKSHLERQGLTDRVSEILTAQAEERARVDPAPDDAKAEEPGVQEAAGTVTITMPAGHSPKLGDYASLLIERGLEPSDWVSVSLTANKWNAMTSDKATGQNEIVEMHQWKIVLKPALHKLLASPAVHVPRVKRTRVGPASSERPELIVVEGDHQFPYHDQRLHEASLTMLADLSKRHRLAEQCFLGDSGDYPTVSRHDDHPAAMAPVNAVLQCNYDRFREKRDAAPNIRVRKLLGNHDWRLQSELLKRAERMYGITPAQREGHPLEIPALHLNRLLHLPELGIELVESKRGWQHAEIELVPGQRGLVVRHGYLTGANTAEATMKKRGRSIIVGHIHRRQMDFWWDPSTECERVGAVAGTMSMVRGGLDEQGEDAESFPGFAPMDNWLQGCVIVTRWPGGSFNVEHAAWDGEALRWRSELWR